MGILEDLRDGKPCRWTGVCSEMSAVGGCTCGEAADEIDELVSILSEIVSQIDQGGSDGKVFARDNCIQRARTKLSSYK